MKKIIFYILDIEPDNNAIKYHKQFSNSFITYDKFTKICYFNSKFKQEKEQIKYHYSKIVINADIKTTINSLLPLVIKEAKKISKENMEKEKRKGSMESAILLIFNKYLYYSSKDNKTIFDLLADIFIKILMGHYLYNGNKRVALMFLKGILWHFGYYLKWTKGIYENYKIYEDVITDFVEKLENKKQNNKEKMHDQIKQWISNNVIIGLNWRI